MSPAPIDSREVRSPGHSQSGLHGIPLAPTILLLQATGLGVSCRNVVGGYTRATMGVTVSFDRMALASP